MESGIACMQIKAGRPVVHTVWKANDLKNANPYKFNEKFWHFSTCHSVSRSCLKESGIYPTNLPDIESVAEVIKEFWRGCIKENLDTVLEAVPRSVL